MALHDEIKKARKQVVTDGYEMSMGEIINLYRDEELVIDPVFQRLYRWDDERKTRFIESLILGIPIPPIFVYQTDDGLWELVDGLQRLSTLFQLTGDLKGERAEKLGPLVLNGTRLLPSLDRKRWEASSSSAENGIGKTLQIEIKRARIRVEILKSQSHASAKFELFQRLNTGGVSLTEQEVRNCIAVSLNRDFFQWILERSNDENFIKTTCLTETAIESQFGVELVLRFLAFRFVPYQSGMDVHEYLDDALIKMATETGFDKNAEGRIFTRTFHILNEALGDRAFKRWDGSEFSGKFLISIFEVMAKGVSTNIDALESLENSNRKQHIKTVAQGLWGNEVFRQNSGAGVRGTTRLARLLPIGPELLTP